MITLLDLMETGRTCGACVHLNAQPGRGVGPCTPAQADRAATDPACGYWFGLEQLQASIAQRPRKAA